MLGRRARHYRVGVLGALVLAALTGAASAGPSVVVPQLQQLRDRVRDLRHVEWVQATESSRLAGFEVRLGRLEEELRRLTGRIEQLEFGQRNFESRLDQLISDLDRRLSALEGGSVVAPPASASGAASGGAAEASPSVPQPVPKPATPEIAVAAPATPAPGSQDLGRIPESALTTLPPRPDPSTITPPATTSLSPQDQYDAAMDLLRAGDYAGAEGGLQLFLELNPSQELAANAAYWLAETYYVRRNFAAAAAAFARNYRAYGKGAAKAPDNLLKLGMSLQGLGESDKACRSYAELGKAFPDAPAHIKQALVRERSRASCA